MEKPAKRLYSWEISDEFWIKVEPLIPQKQRNRRRKYLRDPGGGRKPISPRIVLAGIVYVLRTGIQWKALPKSQFGCPSAIHRYFLEWQKAGFFEKMWKAGLAEYDEMEGIAWKWQSIDGGMNKAPLAIEEVGRNPTDRGKKWQQTKHSRRRPWHPAVSRRQRSPETRCETVAGHLG
jgi:transposase